MDIAAKIEKNRTALLRMVRLWLCMVSLLRCDRSRLIPRRLCRWLLTLLHKAEKAAYFLTLAASFHSHSGKHPNRHQRRYGRKQMRAKFGAYENCGKRHITVAALLNRLHNLEERLVDLSANAEEMTHCRRADAHIEPIKFFLPSVLLCEGTTMPFGNGYYSTIHVPP